MEFRKTNNNSIKSCISVVLGSLNRLPFLQAAITTVRKDLTNISESEIIVIDGGSTDGSIEWLTKQKDVLLILQHNHGEWNGKKVAKQNWGYYMNLGFKAARYNYILMISDDCLLIKDSIINALHQINDLEKASIPFGAIAFQWRHWPDWEKYGIAYFYNKAHLNHGIYSKAALEKVGYADELNYSFYAGDVDLSFKLHNANLPVIPAQNSYLEHFNHANADYKKENYNKQQTEEDMLRKKWSNIWGADFFNQNIRWRREVVDFVDPEETYKAFIDIQNNQNHQHED